MWVGALFGGIHLMVLVNALLISFLAEAVKHLQILNYNLRRIVQLTTKEARAIAKKPPLLRMNAELLGCVSIPMQVPISTSLAARSEERNPAPQDVLHCKHISGESFSNLQVESSRPPITERSHVNHFQIERDRLLQANLKKCSAHHQSIIRFVRMFC